MCSCSLLLAYFQGCKDVCASSGYMSENATKILATRLTMLLLSRKASSLCLLVCLYVFCLVCLCANVVLVCVCACLLVCLCAVCACACVVCCVLCACACAYLLVRLSSASVLVVCMPASLLFRLLSAFGAGLLVCLSALPVRLSACPLLILLVCLSITTVLVC